MTAIANVYFPIIPGEFIPEDWWHQAFPSNMTIGHNSVTDSVASFRYFFSKLPVAAIIGNNVTISRASIATEENALIEIGDYTFISHASITCFEKIIIGRYVCINGGVTITDSDFHPLNPEERIQDTIALSPVGNKANRPPISARPVIIEDDVWIGYNATILKGVTIGRSATILPGAVVISNVPANAIVGGNPATIVNQPNDR